MKLQEKWGLLGDEVLLQDCEEKVAVVELLSRQLGTLEHPHAGLLLTYRGIQKTKAKEANSSFVAEDDQREASVEKK